jgi:hypothetical protein
MFLRGLGQLTNSCAAQAEGGRTLWDCSSPLLIWSSLSSLIVVVLLTAIWLPDALWIGGVYGGGDYDDLTGASGDAGTPAASVWDVRPCLALLGRLPRRHDTANSDGSPSALHTRSPPLA